MSLQLLGTFGRAAVEHGDQLTTVVFSFLLMLAELISVPLPGGGASGVWGQACHP
jgi:hypothetical protein